MRDWEPIKAICDKATPGPWEVESQDGYSFADVECDTHCVATCWVDAEAPNAEFIALSRTSLPEAISEIEQLRQDKAELVDLLEDTARLIQDFAEDTISYFELTKAHYDELVDAINKYKPERSE